MGRLGLGLLAGACTLALLAPGSAPAANVTVGSPLTATFGPATIGSGAVTLLNTALPEPGANVTSPIDGAIVRWRIQGASGGPFRLRVLTPVSGTTYTGGGSTGAETPKGPGLETFTTVLPIKAGQTVALDNTLSSDQIGAAAPPGAGFVFWFPQLADGEAKAGIGPQPIELAYNAEVQPPPTVSSVAPSSGSIQGGTGVVITGNDFGSVKSVAFGATPAQSFGVGSENQITAVAPAAAGPGPVDVTVTTVAGKSSTTPGDQFTYTACVAPKLKKKKLKAARKALVKAGCALGKVKRVGKAGKKARVIKQSAKPGTILPPGAKVNVKLGGK
jgi:IPT/TIG domain-containing protein/PASTA domain-containing protein